MKPVVMYRYTYETQHTNARDERHTAYVQSPWVSLTWEEYRPRDSFNNPVDIDVKIISAQKDLKIGERYNIEYL